jgi:hypothetical protein
MELSFPGPSHPAPSIGVDGPPDLDMYGLLEASDAFDTSVGPTLVARPTR